MSGRFIKMDADIMLQFSSTKSETIIFSRKQPLPNINLTLNNQPLKETTSVKLPGITFNSRLTWKPHIEKLKIDSSQRLNIL